MYESKWSMIRMRGKGSAEEVDVSGLWPDDPTVVSFISLCVSKADTRSYQDAKVRYSSKYLASPLTGPTWLFPPSSHLLCLPSSPTPKRRKQEITTAPWSGRVSPSIAHM